MISYTSTPVSYTHLITLATGKVRVELNKQTGLMKVINLGTNACVIDETAPVVFEPKKVTVTLKEQPDEYFYGGGVQNLSLIHIYIVCLIL